MKLAITGTSGYIGSNFLNTNNGFAKIYSFSSRIGSEKELSDILSSIIECDYYIHLGESSDVASVNSNSEQCSPNNLLLGLVNLGYSKILYASSSRVYGFETEFPHKEIESVVHYDRYSNQKLINEEIVINGGGTVLRIANIYGGVSKKSTLINKAIQTLTGEKILNLDHNPKLDFIHLSDVTTMMRLAVTNFNPGIFNVGSGVGISLNEILDLLANALALPKISAKDVQKETCILNCEKARDVHSFIVSKHFYTEIQKFAMIFREESK